jgi:hypothetical protein
MPPGPGPDRKTLALERIADSLEALENHLVPFRNFDGAAVSSAVYRRLLAVRNKPRE